jgi:MinD superfamily P-loop ATPase
MIITVASGKGGTGKTTVAVSLALSLAESAESAGPLFLDCDVEEPNAALFLHPIIQERRPLPKTHHRRTARGGADDSPG